MDIFVELLGLHRGPRVECELTIALHLDILAVHFDSGFTLVDAKEMVVRVEIVKPGLAESNILAVLRDDNAILRVQLGHLDSGFAFVQPEFGIRQAGRNHHCRAVVAESEKDARR